MWLYFFAYLIIFIWTLDIVNFALLSARYFFYSFKYFWFLFWVAVKLLENSLILWDLLLSFFCQDQSNIHPRANLPPLLDNTLWIICLILLCFMKFYDTSWLGNALFQVNCSTPSFPLFFPVMGSLLKCMCWSAKSSRGPSEVFGFFSLSL